MDALTRPVYTGFMTSKKPVDKPKDPIAVAIGARLARARNDSGLTLDEVVARVPGLSSSRLSNYENGIRRASIEIIKKLAPIYGARAAYLAGLEDEDWPTGLKEVVQRWQSTDERGRVSIESAAAAQPKSPAANDAKGNRETA